jgi:hypothetical protein
MLFLRDRNHEFDDAKDTLIKVQMSLNRGRKKVFFVNREKSQNSKSFVHVEFGELCGSLSLGVLVVNKLCGEIHLCKFQVSGLIVLLIFNSLVLYIRTRFA